MYLDEGDYHWWDFGVPKVQVPLSREILVLRSMGYVLLNPNVSHYHSQELSNVATEQTTANRDFLHLLKIKLSEFFVKLLKFESLTTINPFFERLTSRNLQGKQIRPTLNWILNFLLNRQHRSLGKTLKQNETNELIMGNMELLLFLFLKKYSPSENTVDNYSY